MAGLDGEAHSMDRLNGLLKHARLHQFEYPTGHALNWTEMTELAAAKLKALDTGLLVGESFGGAVALKTAILQPLSVKSLCLLGSFSAEPEPLAAGIGRTASRLLPKVALNPISRWLADWKLAGNLRGEERKKFLEFFGTLDHAELGRRLGLLKGFDVSDRLVGVHCHVEILYGSQDRIAANDTQLKLWQRLERKRLHSLDGAGHVIAREVPIGVARRIDDWAEVQHAA